MLDTPMVLLVFEDLALPFLDKELAILFSEDIHYRVRLEYYPIQLLLIIFRALHLLQWQTPILIFEPISP
jgi:hypothetical protein